MKYYFQKVGQLGRKNHSWKGGKPKCVNCNKQLKDYRSKRCWSCCGRNSRLGKKGKLASNWRGGLTEKNHIQRIKFMREVRKNVLQRDNYTCQICSADKNLHVDHIQPWAEYTELRFNMDNCRTLCAECHYFITFGKKMPKESIWGIKEVNINE